MVDEAYSDREEWTKKSIRTTAKVCFSPSFRKWIQSIELVQMGKFSSDRAINDYAESYWNIEATPVPNGKDL